MIYLIVKCDELSDQWECDAYREPVYMTDDYSTYGLNYEVYELQEDNTFKLIKEYDKALEEGVAIYEFNDETQAPSVIYEKHKNRSTREITKLQVKKWKEKYGFTESVEEIYYWLHIGSSYGEEVNGKYIVIGYYADEHFSSGF